MDLSRSVFAKLTCRFKTHQPLDGEIVEYSVLTEMLPLFRWDLALLGELDNVSEDQIDCDSTLIGRIKNGVKVVVPLLNMRPWLDHYNKIFKDQIQTPVTIDDLRRAQILHVANTRKSRAHEYRKKFNSKNIKAVAASTSAPSYSSVNLVAMFG